MKLPLRALLNLTDGDKGTVTVINVGEAATEATIRKALAIGATDAVRINALSRMMPGM
jgi:electron transfer flavoprotein beta subunit